MSSEDDNPVRIDVRSPHFFGLQEVVVVNALGLVPATFCGLFLGGGSVGSVGIALLLFSQGYLIHPTPGFWSLLLLASVLLSILLGLTLLYLFPYLMNANYYVRSIVSRIHPEVDTVGYACQVTAEPRYCKGIRAFLEDADDVGTILITGNAMVFRGDHIDFTVPYSEVVSLRFLNIGWRGFWFIGRKIRVELKHHERLRAIHIVERQSSTVKEARRLSVQLFESIEKFVKVT